ncbi:efflux RND transporter permease subunit [Serratia marcescens]|uniref:efflux RND transporter permease subunit n=1 Tax=Serratia marcescens TaxID=615 RepID=UPI000F7F634D|nr:efflux RND transporter permease subunit [Serratia marcescens]RTF30453.1 efflux RND transporter permease subunit [Serratia marcescens]RTG67037.1 efflux RND transporter permease subunit [Serratia marcescens]
MTFTDLFVRRPVLALVVSTLILLFGALALSKLPIRQYPLLENSTITISTDYPGASSELMQGFVTQPIAQAVSSVEGVDYLSSSSVQGRSVVTVRMALNRDSTQALTEVMAKVNQVRYKLPEQAYDPVIERSAGEATAVAYVGFSSKTLSTPALSEYLTRVVEPMFTTIDGVAKVEVFGGQKMAMRLWLDSDRLAGRGLTAADVADAVRRNNYQAAPGKVKGQYVVANVRVNTDLTSVEEFRNLVVRNDGNGLVRLKDVGTVELGAAATETSALMDGEPAVFLGVFPTPTGNPLVIVDGIRHLMPAIDKMQPPGVKMALAFETARFIQASIDEVVHTLLEALAIVVAVIYLCLGSLRTVLIPVVTIPLSILGAAGLMLAFGFSVNLLTLLAMVLAIGLVVDDAIVVVENVERNIEEGLSPLAAAHQAMREVSGPIIAIAVVLCAVFVPMAFLSGVTGQFYKQFAVTIAISTVISAINSLTLSPALAARLLKPHGAPKDLPSRLIDRLFGWLFRPFNRFFASGSQRYQHGVSRVLGRRGAVFVVYLLLLAAAGVMFKTVPGGFIPTQDKLYLIGGVKMPEGASLERTDAVIRKMSAIGLSVDGVTDAVAFPGLNALQFTNTPNTGTVFFALESLSTRTRTAAQINAEINARISQIQEGFAFSIMPPPILGIGQGSGYSLYVQDRAGLGYGALQTAINTMSGAIMQTPGMGFPISSYQANVPQLDAKIDRDKAKAQGVPLNALFSTLQTYLGSSYINDFNRYGRTWKVMAQADGQFRDSVEDIANLRTRNDKGEMVPIGSMVSIGTTYGPDPVIRYNGFPAADLIGDADPRVLSSTQAMGALTQMAGKLLPNGMNIQWTDLSYQQSTQGNAALVVFPVAVLLAFLALAALYESWTLPLAVILIVPMTMLSALFGVWLTGGDNNVFVQVGLVVLMGLACKNAILIVEFARELEMQGKGIVEAALEACRLRLRPIVMTSIAFIAGTIPLILGHGAGAEVRGVTGITVFSGMLGVTLFGLFLTPVFYVTLRRLVARKAQPQTA